jgi:hypothetical protein
VVILKSCSSAGLLPAVSLAARSYLLLLMPDVGSVMSPFALSCSTGAMIHDAPLALAELDEAKQ